MKTSFWVNSFSWKKSPRNSIKTAKQPLSSAERTLSCIKSTLLNKTWTSFPPSKSLLNKTCKLTSNTQQNKRVSSKPISTMWSKKLKTPGLIYWKNLLQMLPPFTIGSTPINATFQRKPPPIRSVSDQISI